MINIRLICNVKIMSVAKIGAMAGVVIDNVPLILALEGLDGVISIWIVCFDHPENEGGWIVRLVDALG